MANVKITDLTELAAVDVATNDVLPIVDINTDTTKKVTIESLTTSLAASNDFVTFTRLNANINTVQDNVTANFNQLDANINVVQDNVASLSVSLTIGADSGSDDTVTVGTDTLNFVGQDGITTTVSDNQIAIDLDDTAVTAGVYGGKIGTVSNVPVITIDAQGRITSASNSEVAVDLTTLEGNVNTVSSNVEARNTQLNANLDVVQDNVATNATDIAAVEARRAANVDSADNNAAAVEARRVANIAGAISTVLTSDLTADRAMVTDSSGKIAIDTQVTATELNHLNGVTSAIQPQISTLSSDQNLILTNLRHFAAQANANIDVVSGNVDARHTQLNANIDVVQDNVAARNTQLNANIDVVQDNVAAITDGTTNFTGEVTMDDDLVVTGNLTVNGTTTTVASTNLNVSDRLLMLANGATGSPSADVGVLFNRGDEGNAAIFYDESATTFKLSDTKDPSSNSSLSPVTAANLDLGILTAATVKFDGADLNTAITDNVALLDTRANAFATFTKLDANIDVVSSNTDAVEARRVANIAGAISSVLTSDLTASRAVETDGSGKLTASSVTTTELGKLSGLTATTAELNYTDVTTLGTVQASKAVTADSSGEFLLPDDKAIKFGTGGDFTIKFDGSDAFLEGPSTGEVRITTNQFQVFNKAGTQTMFRVDGGSITNLYNAGSLKLQTKDDGVRIVGEMQSNNLLADGNITLGLNTSNTVTVRGSLDAPTLKFDGTSVSTALTDNVALLDTRANAFATYTKLNANIDVVSSNSAAVEARRVANIAGAVSTITTADLTASRALVSGSGGKVEVSDITSTELGYLDGMTQNINSNLVALAAGIAASATGSFPTGDYGLVDSANAATDAFGFAVADLTIFDMSDSPAGELATEDLGAFT